MQQFKYKVVDPIGLHARPAGLLVKEVTKYKSAVTIRNGAKSADAGKLLALLALGVKSGMEITCQVEGVDEAVATSGIKRFLAANL